MNVLLFQTKFTSYTRGNLDFRVSSRSHLCHILESQDYEKSWLSLMVASEKNDLMRNVMCLPCKGEEKKDPASLEWTNDE